MKKYVVAVISFFDNDLKQFIIEAENEYEAAKKGLIEFTSEEHKASEIEHQNIEDYPKDIDELESYYIDCEIGINVIEV